MCVDGHASIIIPPCPKSLVQASRADAQAKSDSQPRCEHVVIGKNTYTGQASHHQNGQQLTSTQDGQRRIPEPTEPDGLTITLCDIHPFLQRSSNDSPG